jgi:hypothetical protein
MLSRYSEVLRELEALDHGTRALMAPEQLTVHGSAPSVGSLSAPLTLIDFCDFESADRARFADGARRLERLQRSCAPRSASVSVAEQSASATRRRSKLGSTRARQVLEIARGAVRESAGPDSACAGALCRRSGNSI